MVVHAPAVHYHQVQVHQSGQGNRERDQVLDSDPDQFPVVVHSHRVMVEREEAVDPVDMQVHQIDPAVALVVAQVEVVDLVALAVQEALADLAAVDVAVDRGKPAGHLDAEVKAVKQIAHRNRAKLVAKRSITYAHQRLAALLFHAEMVQPSSECDVAPR